ncbi:permease [Pararhodospirillum oryzae]|uniref:Permease n=1 Tax=Pararhodospirillum oryzae TaxID=478448 RepID=A0A512HAT4_9PROT|nr:permease [Pararhodospirillum oryzae]GEO82554.1 permease [Pararhodospirillum oryzae]
MLALFPWLADALTYRLLALDPGTRLAEAVHFFIEDTSKIFVLLILIVFVMGLFRTLLAPERVRQILEGRSRALGYVLAVTLGAVTPFCSCSSVPLFIGFLEAGIPLGVTMAFLITSPLVNEVAVVILASVVGWKLAVVYVATGLGVGLIGGVLIDRLRLERWVEGYVWQIRMGAVAVPGQAPGLGARVRYAWGEVRDIVGRIWLYVLIGIGIGAALHGYVPQDLFARYAGPENPFAVPVAVLMGLPLYSNATGIIPVAEALLAKGVPVGTTIAFMMSVVALSPPEFIMLRKVLKPALLVFLGIFLALAFVAVGLLLNGLFM